MTFFLTINRDIGLDDMDGDHSHASAVDPHGDGNTTIEDDHMHIIISGEVQPGGPDNHTHPDVDFPMRGQKNQM